MTSGETVLNGYSVKIMLCKTPSPILHCISQFRENNGCQSYWASQNTPWNGCYSEVVFHSFWWFRVCPIRIYSGLFAGRRLLGLCLFTADNVYCLSGTPDFTHPASSIHQTGNPANTGRWPSAESTSAQRHRRCADIDSALQDGYPPFSSDQHHWHRSVLG